jgi:hypothetical protein
LYKEAIVDREGILKHDCNDLQSIIFGSLESVCNCWLTRYSQINRIISSQNHNIIIIVNIGFIALLMAVMMVMMMLLLVLLGTSFIHYSLVLHSGYNPYTLKNENGRNLFEEFYYKISTKVRFQTNSGYRISFLKRIDSSNGYEF